MYNDYAVILGRIWILIFNHPHRWKWRWSWHRQQSSHDCSCLSPGWDSLLKYNQSIRGEVFDSLSEYINSQSRISLVIFSSSNECKLFIFAILHIRTGSYVICVVSMFCFLQTNFTVVIYIITYHYCYLSYYWRCFNYSNC